MSKRRDKGEQAEDIIRKYLGELREKERRRVALTDEERRSVSQKNFLIDAVYKYGAETICETGLGDASGRKEISRGTISGAIDRLLGSGDIEYRNHQYRGKTQQEDRYEQYPVLNMASNIQITAMPCEDVAFYRTEKRFSGLIAEYINGHFLNDDIFAVDLGGVIMCIDQCLPQKSKAVTKRKSLAVRVEKILKEFDLRGISEFDCKDGYTESQYQTRLMKKAIKQEEEERGRESDFGGEIKTPRERKVKKKSTKEPKSEKSGN